MRIITISREFGSGGRELGKRMADLLDVAYYDKEIIAAIAKQQGLDEGYVAERMEKGSRSYPITIGRTFAYPAYLQQSGTKLLVARQQIIRELAAREDCVIMGQSADALLWEHNPFNLFVYADMPSKLARCRERAPADEQLSDKSLIKKIRQVDAGRAKSREMFSDAKWGSKEGYHLCVNTTGKSIKTIAPHIAAYAKYWLGIE